MDVFSGDGDNLVPAEMLLNALEGVAKKRQSLEEGSPSTCPTNEGTLGTYSTLDSLPLDIPLSLPSEALPARTASKSKYWFSEQISHHDPLNPIGEDSGARGRARQHWVSPQTSPLPAASPRSDDEAPSPSHAHKLRRGSTCSASFPCGESTPSVPHCRSASPSSPSSRSSSTSPKNVSLVQLLSGEDVYGDTVETYLELGDLLGCGANGKVYTAKYLSTGEQVAVKKIKKDERQKSGLVRCFGKKMLNMALTYQHPNLIHYRQFLEDPMSIYVVSDLYTGPDLQTYIAARAPMSEDIAHDLVKQILEALAYFHSCGAVHRDIKPENFMFEDPNCTNLRLIDCGNATLVSSSGLMNISGTPGFVAPEVYTGKCCQKSDMFSVGVILFCALTNRYPFRGSSTSDLFMHARDLKNMNVSTLENDLSCVSKAAREFILSLLEYDPAKRLSAEAALEEEWVKCPKQTDEWMQFG